MDQSEEETTFKSIDFKKGINEISEDTSDGNSNRPPKRKLSQKRIDVIRRLISENQTISVSIDSSERSSNPYQNISSSISIPYEATFSDC